MTVNDTIVITGGAGFIGSNLVRYWLNHRPETVINIDNLTYAGSRNNLDEFNEDDRHVFIQADINAADTIADILATYKPIALLHLAAETHVDRSIHYPGDFIQTNVVGTHTLLQSCLHYWNKLSGTGKDAFRFLHVSTDEVYGSLDASAPPSSENDKYAPSSPYAASKAAADHLVRSYHATYALPVIITNCSNNFGPYQYPEKFIPMMISCALNKQTIPVYGDGQHSRDWLYVEDHCRALDCVLGKGHPGDTYNISSANESTNLQLVNQVCEIIDELRPANTSHKELVQLVSDRPGHDRRYALNADKLRKETGWKPAHSFRSAMQDTIQWYLDNESWLQRCQSDQHYTEWMQTNYAHRGNQ